MESKHQADAPVHNLSGLDSSQMHANHDHQHVLINSQ